MTNRELAEKLKKLILTERKTTNEILALINLGLKKRAYVELGYSSMFDWLVKGFGYSSSAAFRRIEAAKLLNAVPEAVQKLETGEVNLTTLSRAQSAIRKQEKFSGVKLSTENKEAVVEAIQNKSTLGADKTLVSLFPQIAPMLQPEKQTVLTDNLVRHQVNLSTEGSENLKRAKEVLSHKFPNASDGDIIAYALEFLLAKSDPLRKKASTTKTIAADENQAESSEITAAAAVKSNAGVRKITLQKSGGKCVFKDPITGHICGSSYQLQIDHIQPLALGGSDETSNLRTLCRQHNLLMAERSFGKNLINTYRRNSD